jgi:hypothetical protein
MLVQPRLFRHIEIFTQQLTQLVTVHLSDLIIPPPAAACNFLIFDNVSQHQSSSMFSDRRLWAVLCKIRSDKLAPAHKDLLGELDPEFREYE